MSRLGKFSGQLLLLSALLLSPAVHAQEADAMVTSSASQSRVPAKWPSSRKPRSMRSAKV